MSEFAADVAAVNRIAAVPTILAAVCRMSGAGFATVARLSGDTWVACAVHDTMDFGLVPGSELPISATFCREIFTSRNGVVINHPSPGKLASVHPIFVIGGVKSYISVPIILPDGVVFGTLCALSRDQLSLDAPAILLALQHFADLIAAQLYASERYRLSEARLASALEVSELREQFIAVLGHDLRNPLSAIVLGASMLQMRDTDEARIGLLIEKSASRMSELIGNVLDFAKGRLGDGLVMTRNADEPLEPVLNQVIAEIGMVRPEQRIEVRYDFAEPVSSDRDRIGQLLSNLLANAQMHGDKTQPIQVTGHSGDGQFELSVSNGGKALPKAVMARLFQPFSRGDVRPHQQGLGLGLYIASEIARAHNGTLTVSSTAKATVFTLKMPASA